MDLNLSLWKLYAYSVNKLYVMLFWFRLIFRAEARTYVFS